MRKLSKVAAVAVMCVMTMVVFAGCKKVECDICEEEKKCNTEEFDGDEFNVCEDCEDEFEDLTDDFDDVEDDYDDFDEFLDEYKDEKKDKKKNKDKKKDEDKKVGECSFCGEEGYCTTVESLAGALEVCDDCMEELGYLEEGFKDIEIDGGAAEKEDERDYEETYCILCEEITECEEAKILSVKVDACEDCIEEFAERAAEVEEGCVFCGEEDECAVEKILGQRVEVCPDCKEELEDLLAEIE